MKSTILRVLISTFFLTFFFILVKEHWPEIIREVKASDPKMLAATLAVALVGSWAMAVRLTIVFRAQDIKLSWIKALEAVFIGTFFSNFLPTGIGGDVAKAHCLSVTTKEPLRSWTCVFVDRFLGFLVFVTIPVIIVILFHDRLSPIIVWSVFTTVIAVIFVCILLFSRRGIRRFDSLKSWISQFQPGKALLTAYRDSRSLMQNRRLIVGVIWMSVICQAARTLMICCIIRALGAHMDLVYLFLCFQLTSLFGMFPSINGLGLRETGFVFFMKGSLGYPTASAVAILFLFSQFSLSLIGGLIFAFKREYRS